MRFRRSLRYRVALAFALFGGLASLLLAIALYIASHDLEERLIDETLNAELDDYLARRERNPQSLPQATVTIRGYVRPARGVPPRPIPENVRTLGPGRHQVLLDGIPYRSIVADQNGERFYVLYNETRLKRREAGFVVLLSVSVVIMALVSATVGLWLAGRVISPVTELARRVSELRRPEDRATSLAADFPEDEVGELAKDFDRYLDRLQSFIQRERSFTSDVSHELRTPLSVIKGAVEVLLADHSLAEHPRQRILRIARSANEMAELSQALLVLAREDESPATENASCDVEKITREVVEKYQSLFHAKPIEVNLEVHAPPTLPVDRAVLAMVLGNLVRNAYSYTDAGHIDITVDADGITVADTGRGIDEHELERVFQRHYRGATSSGAGIGLSLVKRICDRYGWRIDLESEPGQGTRSRLNFSGHSRKLV